ncbi:LVIVD repeat-containing protein [Claveliimonas monacensis]|nr:DUF1998 domain-containing protein [Claveliimonas monacensis]
MKKCRNVLLIIISLYCMTVIGCDKEQEIKVSTDDIEVGVIETKGNKEESRIIFYDNKLNEIGVLPLEFATVGDIFYTPLVLRDELYIIPQGYANKKDEEKVLEINLTDLDIEEYSIEQIAMNSIAVADNYIFTCNNLNGVSYINRCNMNNESTKTVEIPDVYVSNLICENDTLYAFVTKTPENGITPAFLYQYDEELKLLGSIDISECGTNQYKAVGYKDYIFFTSLSDSTDNPTNTVGKFNTVTNSLEIIYLEQKHALDLAIYDGCLYVSHYDLVQKVGGGMSVYDLETKKIENYHFEHGMEQMAIMNEKIYILSDWKIYVYDINNISDMTPIRSIEVSSMDKEFSYLSGMFTVDNRLD